MLFSHHQLLGRSRQFPWHHLWPVLLKYSSFPGNNSLYDQNRISLPILMYYTWDLQPKNEGWHKKGEKRARGKRKIEEPSSGLIWQMQSRKRAAVPVGVEKLNRMIFFLLLLHQPRCRFVRLESDWIKLSPGPEQSARFVFTLPGTTKTQQKEKKLCWRLLSSGRRTPFGPRERQTSYWEWRFQFFHLCKTLVQYWSLPYLRPRLQPHLAPFNSFPHPTKLPFTSSTSHLNICLALRWVPSCLALLPMK